MMRFIYPTPIPAKILVCSLWRTVMSGQSEQATLTTKTSHEFQPTWPWYLNVTDRRLATPHSV